MRILRLGTSIHASESNNLCQSGLTAKNQDKNEISMRPGDLQKKQVILAVDVESIILHPHARSKLVS